MSEFQSYAQNREDVYINWILSGRKKGFYVDVGANDPEVDSVTKHFYDEGWRGINIEPIQHHFDHLLEARPRDINVQAGISQEHGTLMFREYVDADGLSTLSQDMKKQNKTVVDAKTRDYEIAVRPLSEVIAKQVPKNTHIDFLKIDVEGYEYEVIASNDWKKYRPDLVVIEANHVHHDWRPMLIKSGYTLLFFDGVNEYYVTEKIDRAKVLAAYPTAVIGITVLEPKHREYAGWRESVADARAQDERTTLLDEFAQKTAGMHAEINTLHDKITQVENQSFLRFSLHKLKHLHVRIRGKLQRLQRPPLAQNNTDVTGEQLALQPVTEDVLTQLKQEDVAVFVPSIEQSAGLTWRVVVFGALLRTYDFSVRAAKKIARSVR